MHPYYAAERGLVDDVIDPARPARCSSSTRDAPLQARGAALPKARHDAAVVPTGTLVSGAAEGARVRWPQRRVDHPTRTPTSFKPTKAACVDTTSPTGPSEVLRRPTDQSGDIT